MKSPTPMWTDIVIAAAATKETKLELRDALTIASLLIAAAAIAVNGYRADRARRRELYASALAAVVAYQEFAFAVRRRDEANPGSERVRITTALSTVQAELARLGSLVSTERSDAVATAYSKYVSETQAVAGGIIRDSWNEPPIGDDADVHSPEISEKLSGLNAVKEKYLQEVKADLAVWRIFTMK